MTHETNYLTVSPIQMKPRKNCLLGSNLRYWWDRPSLGAVTFRAMLQSWVLGFTGLSAALRLAEAGVIRSVVLNIDNVGWGAIGFATVCFLLSRWGRLE